MQTTIYMRFDPLLLGSTAIYVYFQLIYRLPTKYKTAQNLHTLGIKFTLFSDVNGTS